MKTIDADFPHIFAPANHTASQTGVQILSMILFAAFAIVATTLAFVWFPPGGVVLAIIFAIRGFGPLVGRDSASKQKTCNTMTSRQVEATATALPATGNVSFDAYRADMLDRLESERRTFEDFLSRLRDAKDKSEFDTFMDDRAKANREADAASMKDTPMQPGTGAY